MLRKIILYTMTILCCVGEMTYAANLTLKKDNMVTKTCNCEDKLRDISWEDSFMNGSIDY